MRQTSARRPVMALLLGGGCLVGAAGTASALGSMSQLTVSDATVLAKGRPGVKPGRANPLLTLGSRVAAGSTQCWKALDWLSTRVGALMPRVVRVTSAVSSGAHTARAGRSSLGP